MYTREELIILFFVYSILGWVGETSVASIRKKQFKNRGFLSGPMCFIYGTVGVIITVFLQELRNNHIFLFMGCMIIATAIQWFVGKTLERIKQRKWWDYSGKKINFDGYICLGYSLLWGAVGYIAVKYANGVITKFYGMLPSVIRIIVLWTLIIVGIIDLLGSLLIVNHMERKIPKLFVWNRKLNKWTMRQGHKIAAHINSRIDKAHPDTREDKAGGEDDDHCDFVQLFWLFFIGAFLGDIVETIFCRITEGVWMSRSSLVWGPFSIVWGLAIALATALLHKDRSKPDSSIFITGTLLGGAYEYVCSVFTELVFGKVFWDYSKIPFNLGGRINLLYCFFWGIAAVVWIKVLYPRLAKIIKFIREKTGCWLTVFCMIFMVINMLVSVAALIRYDQRGKDIDADNFIAEMLDEHFDDEIMKIIYPNAKQR